MAEAAPPKKRKLTHRWLAEQLHDFDESVQSLVAGHLSDFDEDDLKNAQPSFLFSLLPAGLEQKTQPPQPAPWLKHNQYVASFPFLGLVVSFLCGS